MRWVSREAFDAVVNTGAVLMKENDRLSARYDSLLEKYHALKLQGAVIVEPSAPIERKEQDEVVRRINILSVGKPGQRAQMLRQLENDRKLLGLNDIAILQRIEAGVTADEGTPA